MSLKDKLTRAAAARMSDKHLGQLEEAAERSLVTSVGKVELSTDEAMALIGELIHRRQQDAEECPGP